MTQDSEIPFIHQTFIVTFDCTVSQDIAGNPETNGHQNDHQTLYPTGISPK
jgi:hypothetical protein